MPIGLANIGWKMYMVNASWDIIIIGLIVSFLSILLTVFRTDSWRLITGWKRKARRWRRLTRYSRAKNILLCQMWKRCGRAMRILMLGRLKRSPAWRFRPLQSQRVLAKGRMTSWRVSMYYHDLLRPWDTPHIRWSLVRAGSRRILMYLENSEYVNYHVRTLTCSLEGAASYPAKMWKSKFLPERKSNTAIRGVPDPNSVKSIGESQSSPSRSREIISRRVSTSKLHPNLPQLSNP